MGHRRNSTIKSPMQGRKSKRYMQDRKLFIYQMLGNRCVHCSESDKRVLQIDHKYSDGNKERNLSRSQLYKKVEKSTHRYQLLCANCNWRKRSKDFKVQSRNNILWRTKVKLFSAGIISITIIIIGVYHAT